MKPTQTPIDRIVAQHETSCHVLHCLGVNRATFQPHQLRRLVVQECVHSLCRLGRTAGATAAPNRLTYTPEAGVRPRNVIVGNPAQMPYQPSIGFAGWGGVSVDLQRRRRYRPSDQGGDLCPADHRVAESPAPNGPVGSISLQGDQPKLESSSEPNRRGRRS